jgi:hypothetical protein
MDNTIEQRLQEAKAKSGCNDILVVETDVAGMETAAFRVPTSMEWNRYRTMASDSNTATKAAAARPLVFSCCIYPDPASFEAAVDAHPGLIETFIGELIEHAGANRAKKVRKL